jgi:hypothetical protein
MLQRGVVRLALTWKAESGLGKERMLVWVDWHGSHTLQLRECYYVKRFRTH